ncbi:MAG: tripartite tricarboxylate transporter substrate binding protein [Betaproteobacteria bacterium]|jgi:tripartite-type tricarboxylate transporter receptor subunit TctC|nr:tripartite tricarboxylate transporter substrate binding protein [Betaproteobacteria bacterium]NDB43621.1 tripartite tricarboxylate transporter substrate binding protein [Betaproteobacteria bacterium]NDD23124.1 tripartite tricarboxylate transporter substrate binding protein [Betaproteobacteria bacterium]NDE25704.1 tripartite tricarboxylate transporter substrate binding protein [Betaproteobacteria bacterium]NDF78418.1 tripartite tricarboxylate transporter substrate binding protein [Betaproteob
MTTFLKAVLGCSLMACMQITSWAQSEWPKAKPVSLVVAFAPGASTDIVARTLTQKLNELTGGNFIVENKGGAGGNIASAQVKRSAPDGYTLLVHSVAFAVNPSLYAEAGYDALKDFVPVALGPKTPNIFTVNPTVDIKNLTELVEAAKKTPLNYASSGIGTTTHLSMERLKTAAKIDIVHVPYQPAAAINAVVAGHTQIASTSMPPAVPMIKAGKLKAIAVTSATRSPLLPDVPSITELGYKEFDDYTWFGFFAPAGTPPEVINKLNAAINRAMASSEVVDRFAQLGMASTPNTVAEFGSFLKAEVPKWAAVVKSSGAKAD